MELDRLTFGQRIMIICDCLPGRWNFRKSQVLEFFSSISAATMYKIPFKRFHGKKSMVILRTAFMSMDVPNSLNE